jgi:hypothetical protein
VNINILNSNFLTHVKYIESNLTLKVSNSIFQHNIMQPIRIFIGQANARLDIPVDFGK